MALGLGVRGKQEEKGEDKWRSEPSHVAAAACCGLEELHLRAFARPEVHGMAHQVHLFEGACWAWWPAHCCVLAHQLF